jgi:opine dehydrogenase
VTEVAVLGAGAGGLSTAVELTLAGHKVHLWNRHNPALAPYLQDRTIPFTGVLGDATVQVEAMTTDLRECVHGADVVVVSLPALAHARLFADLAGLSCVVPIVLNPGHTGGALHARAIFQHHEEALPPIAELSTLLYVARTTSVGVRITNRAGQVRCAGLPGAEAAIAAATALFPGLRIERDVLATSLSNVNMVLHPPGAILSAAWVEAPHQFFTFYVDALTPGVARVIEILDAERRKLAARFGHDLPSLIDEMALLGTASLDAVASRDIVAAIREGEANRTILAPDSLGHRYYEEDLPYGLVPLVTLAEFAGVAVPMARALLTVGEGLLGRDLLATGLGRRELGIEGLDYKGLMMLVGGS